MIDPFQRMPFITALISGANRWLTSAAKSSQSPGATCWSQWATRSDLGCCCPATGRTTAGDDDAVAWCLIDCAQRLMDDKQLATQPAWMAWIRPLLKTMVRQRWLSTRAVPQCGTARRDPQCVEAGLSQWRQHRRRPGGSAVSTRPNAKVHC